MTAHCAGPIWDRIVDTVARRSHYGPAGNGGIHPQQELGDATEDALTAALAQQESTALKVSEVDADSTLN